MGQDPQLIKHQNVEKFDPSIIFGARGGSLNICKTADLQLAVGRNVLLMREVSREWLDLFKLTVT